MNKIKPVEDVIDLTDDTPYSGTAAAPDIEYVGESIAHTRPTCSRRRQSANSDVVIVEDDVPDVLHNGPTLPPVACHFFYPTEDDGGGEGAESDVHDPLAPIPEWVDCSTLHSEQVSVDEEPLALESLPERNDELASTAYDDPLCIYGTIKTEPELEIDVKPLMAQISEMVHANKLGCVGIANSVIKKEILITDKNNISNKQNNSHTVNKLNKGKTVGPKCAQLRQKEDMSSQKIELKSSQDIDLNSATPKNKLDNKRKVGPKSAQFRQKDKDMSSSKIELKSSEDIDLNSTTPKKKMDNERKVGPKCAQFRQKEKDTSSQQIKLTNSQDIYLNSTIPTNKLDNERKVGPKCAHVRFRQKEKDMSSPKIELENSHNNDIKTISPPKKTDTPTKVGPKCAKFRLKETREQKTTRDRDSKDIAELKKILSYDKEMEKNIVIKPAVVSIGPKLPLPQCFQRKQSFPQETLQCTNDEFTNENKNEPDNNLDKDHIVLKIYTCFRCNHKCTDPLFHEAHLNICSSKRRCKSLNLSLQDYSKQNGFYKCEICPFKFKNQENLTVHLNHHGVKGFICHICQLTFLTLSKLNQHSLSDHKNLEKVFSCNVCEYSSLNFYKLKDHMVQHNKDKDLFCSSCRQNYEDADDIEKHHQEFHRRSKMKPVRSCIIKPTENVGGESMVINGSKDKKRTSLTSVENKEQPEENNAIGSKIMETASSEICLNTETTMSDDTINRLSVLKSFEAQIIKRNGKYYCNGCFHIFVHLKNLIKHKKHHLRNNPFICCNGSFVSFSYIDYIKHVKENHESSKYTCSICPHTFMTGYSLGKHMVRHVDDGLFCYPCRKNFENTEAYRTHIRSKHANVPTAKYNCIECSFNTPYEANLKMHIAKHKIKPLESENQTAVKYNETKTNEAITSTRQKSEKKVSFDPSLKGLNPDYSPDAFNCTACGLKLTSADALKKHNKAEHEQDQSLVKQEGNASFENEGFRCNKCSFRCSQSIMFIKHMKTGHTKRKFTCNVCRNSFAFLKFYLKHMKNHAACAVVYSCNECKFTSRKELVFAKHMRTHALKCCPQCDYKTLRFDSFKTHLETIHTGENEQASSWNTELQSANTSIEQTNEHVSKTWDSTSQKEIIKAHACCFCTYKTSIIQNLRRHMAVHFNSSSDSSSKNMELSNKVSKPSLTVKGWKSKTLPKKTAVRRVSKVSKLSGKVGNKLMPTYCCTQCDFKHKHRKSVAVHFYRIHKIRGSVRDHTIKKIYAPVPPKETMEDNSDSEDEIENKNRSIEMDINFSHVAETNKGVLKNSVKPVNVIQTDQFTELGKRGSGERGKPTKCLVRECSSCDLQKLSLLARLQHRKFGHMGFWCRPFSCKICGFRCADKANLAKHLKWKHAGAKKDHKQTNNAKIHKSVEDYSSKTDRLCDDPEKQYPPVKKRRRSKMKKIECQECNIESFSRKAQHQHSLYGHDAFWNRSISCDICGMRFPNNGAFVVHKKVHKTKLRCTKCQSFVTSKPNNLKVHKQTCKGFKEVEIKSETINSWSAQDRKNGIRDISSDDEESYACGECDFVTRNVIKFSTHMFIHSGIPDD